jgi:hypothetical protein
MTTTQSDYLATKRLVNLLEGSDVVDGEGEGVTQVGNATLNHFVGRPTSREGGSNRTVEFAIMS